MPKKLSFWTPVPSMVVVPQLFLVLLITFSFSPVPLALTVPIADPSPLARQEQNNTSIQDRRTYCGAGVSSLELPRFNECSFATAELLSNRKFGM